VPRRFNREEFFARSPEESSAIVQDYLANLLGAVLGFPASEIDARQSLTSMGLDSLTALELRNAVERDLEVSVSMAIFLDAPTVLDLAKSLAAHARVQDGTPEAVAEHGNGRDKFVV
jgi:acyl carrier protein